MFVKNCWYVAAHGSEVDEKPRRRTVAGDDIVLFRVQSGSVGALEDRCAHRLAPLSAGWVVGETVQCPYHGAQYGLDGACVAIPGQTGVPRDARIRRFPVLERHGFVWVWTGDPTQSVDESTIPDFYDYVDDPAWDWVDGSILSMKCGYQLVNDNVFDLTHAEFVHASTLGTEGMRATRQEGRPLDQQGLHTFEADIGDREIRYLISIRNTRVMPSFEQGYLRTKPATPSGLLDFEMAVCFRPPGFWLAKPVVKAPGTPTSEGVGNFGVIIATPETETTCHYFHRTAQRHAPGDRDETLFWHNELRKAFVEDQTIIELQQANMGAGDIYDFRIVSFDGDRLGFRARKMIHDMIERERAGISPPRASAAAR